MDLKYLIAQQRRRPQSPSLDIAFALDESYTSRRGPTGYFTRATSGTFVNKNGHIVGKTTSTTAYTPSTIVIGDTVVFDVPSGSVVGWLNGQEVIAHVDSDNDNQVPGGNTETLIKGKIIRKTDTSIFLEVTGKGGPESSLISNWSISYRGIEIDYNPTTSSCLGFLIEEQRINSVTRSGEMHLWNGGGTRVLSTETSPDGTQKATLLTSVVGSYGGYCRTLNNISHTNGTKYTVSAFVKKGNWRYISLDFSALRPAGNLLPFFDLDTLVFNPNGSTTVGSAVQYPNGWVRLIVTGTASSTASTAADFWLTTSNGISNADIGAGQTAHVWGYQVEVGSFATSYIPTTTASATRTRDLLSITGSDFNSFHNSFKGTMFARFSSMIEAQTTGNRSFVSISDESYNNRLQFTKSSGTASVYASIRANNVLQKNFTSAAGVYQLDKEFKLAMSFGNNQLALFSLFGSIDTTTNPITMPTGLKTLRFYDPGDLAANHPTGHIQSFRYYPYRLDTKLQELTTTTTKRLTYNGVPLLFNDNIINITI